MWFSGLIKQACGTGLGTLQRTLEVSGVRVHILNTLGDTVTGQDKVTERHIFNKERHIVYTDTKNSYMYRPKYLTVMRAIAPNTLVISIAQGEGDVKNTSVKQ